ncbi:phosphopantetheine-binding protein [uncultured Treponema sp.]|uniref:phosphopantetheine-binding protein n=1 Tax=uncultured Treponema sp. TaxID=162155 RepID=UPI0025E0DB4C|nr:phosphopantetheine-binding protein [uncultured Treponema sp.]
MEKLMNILTELKPDVDFETEKGLIDNAILDSFDIVQLIGELKDTFEIEISPAEIVPENFNSAEALWAMIQKLQ